MIAVNELPVKDKFRKTSWIELKEKFRIPEEAIFYHSYDRVIRFNEHNSLDISQLIDIVDAMKEFARADYKVACRFKNGLFYLKHTGKDTSHIVYDRKEWNLLPTFYRYVSERDLDLSELTQKDNTGTSPLDEICNEIEEDIGWNISNLAPLWWQSDERVRTLSRKEINKILKKANELKRYLEEEQYDIDEVAEYVEEMQGILFKTFTLPYMQLDEQILMLFDAVESPNYFKRSAFLRKLGKLIEQLEAIKAQY